MHDEAIGMLDEHVAGLIAQSYGPGTPAGADRLLTAFGACYASLRDLWRLEGEAWGVGRDGLYCRVADVDAASSRVLEAIAAHDARAFWADAEELLDRVGRVPHGFAVDIVMDPPAELAGNVLRDNRAVELLLAATSRWGSAIERIEAFASGGA